MYFFPSYQMNFTDPLYRKVPICIAASVYRMSAGNCLPYKNATHRQQEESKIFMTGYERNESPWESYLQRNRNSSSSSSDILDSSCSSFSSYSSRSMSPEPHQQPQKKDKKKSNHMLLREIRRLRNENNSLRTSVSMLKNDLRDIHVSRQDTDASHKKFYDEYMDKNAQLEIDIEDRNDEIKSLKEEINKLKQCHLCHSNQSTSFGCYESEDDNDDVLFCQPIVQESTLPDIVDDKDNSDDERAMNDYLHRRFNLVDISQQEEDEEEDEEEDNTVLLFEPTATSYIHQAMISKLSSARVRLELDDLILKYEPSGQDVVRVLSLCFVDWISSLLTKFVNKSVPEPITASKVFTSHIQNGIVDFWESLLQYYTSEEENQIELLNRIEHDVDVNPAIGDHFDRLILMLYKYHVIDDEAVVSWWQNPLDNENSKKLRKITTRFVEWVQDDDDEDEDDEEEDDDDEDDEEDDEEEEELFSFVESPASEDHLNNEEASDIEELETNQTDNCIDNLLTSQQEHEICVCHLDKDIPKSEPCSCSTYTPSPVIEKKKKSVRIAM
jgi:hypothetical protein